jgi:excisionase family DNA binding protein
MHLLSISEAARELHVNPSRARSLVASGELAGVKVGGRWLVESSAVADRRRTPRPAGRPLTPSNAWAALFICSDEESPWLEPQALWRVRQNLRARGLNELKPRLMQRADPIRFTAHPGELKRLGSRPDLAKSGISAASAYGLDLVAAAEIDGYVRAGDLAAIEQRHALEPMEGTESNVRLRVVPDSAWHLSGRVAPLAAVAVDLSEEDDSRSVRAGEKAIDRIERMLKQAA